MAARTTPIILPAVQLKATDSNGVTPSRNSTYLPRLSIPKPSWIVRTENSTKELNLSLWKRCRTCGGSGLGYCSRCLGTGEYRYIMGFQFMKMENNESKDPKKYNDQTKQHPGSANPEI
uniref:Uncharacterized protein n=1 Tax=Cucumis melo TaxID=3656 RepID=A0A9I9DRH5_CUCME